MNLLDDWLLLVIAFLLAKIAAGDSALRSLGGSSGQISLWR